MKSRLASLQPNRLRACTRHSYLVTMMRMIMMMIKMIMQMVMKKRSRSLLRVWQKVWDEVGPHVGESRVRQVPRDDHIRPVTLPCVHINHGQLTIIAKKSVIISSVTCSVQCLDILIITESLTNDLPVWVWPNRQDDHHDHGHGLNDCFKVLT